MYKAVSYYYSVFSNRLYSGIKVHKTGNDAVKCIEDDYGQVFSTPYVKKGSMKLTKKNKVSIGFAHRKLVARFLTDEEVKLIEKYGEDFIWFDFKNGIFVEPEKLGDEE